MASSTFSVIPARKPLALKVCRHAWFGDSSGSLIPSLRTHAATRSRAFTYLALRGIRGITRNGRRLKLVVKKRSLAIGLDKRQEALFDQVLMKRYRARFTGLCRTCLRRNLHGIDAILLNDIGAPKLGKLAHARPRYKRKARGTSAWPHRFCCAL